MPSCAAVILMGIFGAPLERGRIKECQDRTADLKVLVGTILNANADVVCWTLDSRPRVRGGDVLTRE